MLQVRVSHVRPRRRRRHAQPDLPQAFEQGRFVQVIAHELVEKKAIHPLHLQNRVELAANANAARQVFEIHGEWQLGLDQMLADLGIAVLQSRHFAGEALDGPPGAAGAVKFVNVGKVARARHGHAHGVGDNLPAAEFRIAERGLRVLNRFVVVLGKRPSHGCVSCWVHQEDQACFGRMNIYQARRVLLAQTTSRFFAMTTPLSVKFSAGSGGWATLSGVARRPRWLPWYFEGPDFAAPLARPVPSGPRLLPAWLGGTEIVGS